MGSSPSVLSLPSTPLVNMKSKSNILPFFDEDSTVVETGIYWDIISIEDDKTPERFLGNHSPYHKSKNDPVEKPKPQKSKFCCLEDLHTKASYILSHTSAKSTFIRYLFHGSWIMELLQIPDMYVSPTSNTSINSSLQNFQTEFVKQSLFSVISDHRVENLFAPCVRRMDPYIDSPTLNFLEDSSPEFMNSVMVLTIALALQVFCRSEIFLHLSEQQWSRDSIRSANWQDYARVGRAQVQQYIQKENCEHSCSTSTVALLDELYVKFLLNYDQLVIANYLSCGDAVSFVMDVKECVTHLHMNIAVYDCEQQHQNPSQSSTMNLFHQCHNLSTIHYQQSPELFSDYLSCFPESTREDIFFRLFTSASPTLLFTPSFNPGGNNSVSPEDESAISFACITPVLRCPLMVFTSPLELTSLNEAYSWSLHRIIHCHFLLNDHIHSTSQYELSDSDKVIVALNTSFLLSHILA